MKKIDDYIPSHLKDSIDINAKIQMLIEEFDKAAAKADIVIQKNVIKNLGQLGVVKRDKVVPLLLSQLENDELASCVIEQLGLIGDTSVIPFLVPEVNNSRVDIRVAVAHTLGFLGADNLIPYITKLLNDIDEKVRSASATALSHFVDEKVVSILVKTAISDPSISVRANASSSLMTLVISSPPLGDELLEIFKKVKQEQSSQIFCNELEHVI
ncbi:MAG: HEAT repeat domain-containing protein [Elusimicrobiota bacterium]